MNDLLKKTKFRCRVLLRRHLGCNHGNSKLQRAIWQVVKLYRKSSVTNDFKNQKKKIFFFFNLFQNQTSSSGLLQT